jgi:mannose-6-phosphate isomerase-like protein (cupin superfamily)
MKNISEYIESGIIESYVLGLATADEQQELERLATSHNEVRVAIDEFSLLLEKEATANAVQPDPLIKPMVLATYDYIKRMEAGEMPSTPPLLNETSKISDFGEWLSRPDMTLPASPENIYAKIIAFAPEMTTAIVWIKDMAPQEVHHDELEKFLIVEGSCCITIEGTGHHLTAGDFIAIPLHKKHHVSVTSKVICKVILQRVAA